MSAWRAMLIGLILVFYTAAIGLLGTFATLLAGWQSSSSQVNDAFEDATSLAFQSSDAITFVWLPASLIVTSQVLFLLPVFARRFAPTRHGRSMMVSVFMAAIVAGMLFAGLMGAVGELIYWLQTGKTDVGDLLYEGDWSNIVNHDQWAWWPYVLASWLLWMPLLWLFCKRVPQGRLHSRLVGWLLAGTIVEVVVVLPFDIIVRRKSQCYCNTGTFFALSMSILALLWLAGPGVVLALTSKRRRLWFETTCFSCAYEKGPKPAERCPECGVKWDASAR